MKTMALHPTEVTKVNPRHEKTRMSKKISKLFEHLSTIAVTLFMITAITIAIAKLGESGMITAQYSTGTTQAIFSAPEVIVAP